MSVRINHFEALRQRFPTWEELNEHLTSEGVRWVPSVVPHGIFRYVKGSNASGLLRSVVWDTEANLPLCVAPFKAQEGLPPLNAQLSATEDFVDGCMMNAWVGHDEVLRVATRTQIGGTNTFYDTKTFGQMFEECLATTPLKTMAHLQGVLNWLRMEQGATSAFASFVIQHPDHRIVAKILSPSMYVVHVGTVTATGVVDISERATNWPQGLARLQIPSYPVRLFRTEQEVQDLLRRTGAQRGWRWQGLVFKDGQGARWRLRTPTYALMRELRGSESNSVDRFFRLRSEKRVMDYLKHYAEDRDAFWEMEQNIRARTGDILAAYVDVHKAHTVQFKELPEPLRPAVFLLHTMWRDELRPKGFSVRLQNAIDVVNRMRDFEKRRLMEAVPYVSMAPPVPAEV